MKLYGYWRSSAAYRVRIALHHKGIAFETVPVNLAKGEQKGASYRDVNPQALIPTLVDGDRVLHQSLAILEYLEETHPSPALLPKGPGERARVRARADLVACDIHPLQNTRVLAYLGEVLGASDEQKSAWFARWIGDGLAAFEKLVAAHPETGRFSHGDSLTLADVLLVPQLGNARRWKVPLDAMPTLQRIEAACLELDSFRRAHPSQQPDHVEGA